MGTRTCSQEIEKFIKFVTGDFQDGSWLHVGFKRTRSENMYATKHRKSFLFPALSTQIRRNTNNYTHCYLCPQAFSYGDRSKEKLFALHNIVIDVDCHSERYCKGLRDHKLQLLAGLLTHDAYSEYGLPLPNYIVFTGRGLQIWWHHEPIYVSKGLGTWVSVVRSFIAVITKMIEDHSGPDMDVMESLGGLEVDSQASMNPVGLFRIPGTYNPSANGYALLQECEGSSVVYNYWDLRKFRDEHKVETAGAKAAKGKKAAAKNSKNSKNAKNLENKTATDLLPAAGNSESKNTAAGTVRRWFNHAVDIADWALQTAGKIERLREMRDQDIGEETRNNYCLIHYCLHRTAGMTHDAAVKRLERFNEGFKNPMRDREIKSTLASAKEKAYKYSVRKIVDLLDISKEEAKKIELDFDFDNAGNDETDNKTAQNNEESKTKTETVKERNKQIKPLYLTTDATQEEIGEQFGLSRISVGNILRQAGISRADRKVKKIQKLNENGNSVEQISKKVGCSDRTVYRALKNTASKNAGGAPEAAQTELVNCETDIANAGISESVSDIVAVSASTNTVSVTAEATIPVEYAGQITAPDNVAGMTDNDESEAEAEQGKSVEEGLPAENTCTSMGAAEDQPTDTMLRGGRINGYLGEGGGQARSIRPAPDQICPRGDTPPSDQAIDGTFSVDNPLPLPASLPTPLAAAPSSACWGLHDRRIDSQGREVYTRSPPEGQGGQLQLDLALPWPVTPAARRISGIAASWSQRRQSISPLGLVLGEVCHLTTLYAVVIVAFSISSLSAITAISLLGCRVCPSSNVFGLAGIWSSLLRS